MKKKLSIFLGMIALVSLVGCDNSGEEPKNNQEQQQQQPQEETYTVKFMNGDVVLQESKYHEGDLPSYTGEKPTKPEDADGYYEFVGWDKRITLVSGDTTYNAQFKKTEYANRFVDLQEVYYPYNDNIKQYLSDEEPNVALYNGNTVGVSPIKIKFQSNYPNTTGLKFYYDTREDFSTASVFDLQPTASEVQLYNLLKDQVYYIKLTSIIGDEEKNPIVDSFKTTDLGPRVLKVGGIDNVRDLGGYQTGSTKTLQGMLFRGSEMQGSHGLELNAEGQKVLSEDIGIKLDIDLRGTDEALGITESPINGAAYKRYSITNYAGVFTSSSTKSLLRQLFGDLANENNYPAYIHCYGGADRTGTLCYLINALCGVSDIDLIHDYEYTTFSRFGERNSKTYANNQKMPDFLSELAKLPGETTQEKVRGYLLSCGVSENELNIINAIMHGEEIPSTVTCPEEYSSQLLNKLTLSISGGIADKVQINGKEVQFNSISTGVEISASELSELPEGQITGKVILTNKKELSFSFMNKVLDVVDVEDLATIEGVLKITQKTTLPGVVGYDKYVRAHLKTESDSTGGTQMFIGSYGFVLRGGRLRLENMNSNGAISNKQKGETADVKMFNAGDLDVLLKVNVEDTKVGYDFYATNGSTYQHIVHEEADLKLTSGEIPATEAKVTFNVNSNCPVIYVIPREASFASNVSFNLDEETNILIPASKPELVTKIVINEKEVEFSTEEFALVINKNVIDGINDLSELSGNIYVGETAHPFHVTIIKTILSVEEKVTYTIGEESVSVGFNVPGLVTKVTLDDAEVVFSTDDSHIIIAKSQLGEVKNGQVINGKITAKSQTLSFVINVIEHVNYISGTCTVNSSNKTYIGTTAVGYNGTKLKLNLTTTTSGSGDFFLLIGSYGFELRGGAMRTAKKSSTDATATEFSPRTELKPEGVATNMFDKGGVIEMSLNIKDATTITLTISYVLKDGKTASVSKDLTRLTSNEIPAENSYVYAQVSSCAATFSQAN